MATLDPKPKTLEELVYKPPTGSTSPMGQVLQSIQQERNFMRKVLEKIASTSDNFESKLAQSALQQIDESNKKIVDK